MTEVSTPEDEAKKAKQPSHPLVDEFLKVQPFFEKERAELVGYVKIVERVVTETKGDRVKEKGSALGQKAKVKAIAIMRRYSNGGGIEHKAPLTQFMIQVWEVNYKAWEAKNAKRNAQK